MQAGSQGDARPSATDRPAHLAFDDLTPHLLLKNGNFLYKVPYGEGWAVVKVYYGSRGFLGRLYKSFANVVLYGQTSYMAKTRLRIERECLGLWSREGFRTFAVYDDVTIEAPQAPEGGYLVLEYVDKPKLHLHMSDASIDVEERFALYRRWLQEWGRRHALAVAQREPRLVHENGDGKHVMLLDDGGFLWFDFEMVYRSKSGVRWQVGHEIIQYLWQMCRQLGPLGDRLLEETVAHYPDRRHLEDAWAYFWRSPNPFARVGRALERKLRKRARKPTSKYNIARRLREKLDAAQA